VTPVFEARLEYEAEKQIRRYVAAISKGLLSAAGSGPVAAYPMTYPSVRPPRRIATTESAEPAYSAAAAQSLPRRRDEGAGDDLQPT